MLGVLVALGSVFASAQLPEGIKFDDGFTWVECHQFEVAENSVIKAFWVPEISVRLLGGAIPDRSGFKFTLKQEGKKISEYLTDGYPVRLANQPASGMNIVGYWKDTQRTDASGAMTLDVTYIDGATNKEYLAKTLKLDIRKAPRTRAFVGSREPYAPSFYVNRHSEILSNILYFRDYEFPAYTMNSGLTYYSARMVELVFNYSDNEDYAPPAQGRIVVEVDGKVIDMKLPDNTVPQDTTGIGESAGHYNVEHSDRDAEQYFKSGPAYRERIGFARRSLILPLQWGPPLQGRPKSNVFTNDHPGEWKITYFIERVPVRVFRFKVGADGLPVPHAEQAAGLVLAPNAILVDTEIPGSGGVFDGRLTPEFVKLGGFFGRAWASAEMKARAASVPTKGRPFPVSSAKKGG